MHANSEFFIRFETKMFYDDDDDDKNELASIDTNLNMAG